MTHKDASPGVVVCVEPLAATVGNRVLREGGNAFDAAIATAYAQGVVNPMMCGLGGTARVNLYLARSREHLSIEAFGGAGSLARPDTFEYTHETGRAGRWAVRDNANYVGYQAAIVPTFVRVTGETHRLFGSRSWDMLLQPAIDLAVNGFEVSPWLASRWDPHSHGAVDWPTGMETLTTTESCAEIYLNQGRFYKAGETLVQSDYGQTLRRIADEGPSVFYEGEVGQNIAQDYEKYGGLFTQQDLLQCRAYVARTLETTYRDYTLHGRGSIQMEIYNILEGFDLRPMGHNSSKYLETLARVLQVAYLDRARYIADPQFTDVPKNRIRSKEHAAERRTIIQSDQDIYDVEVGFVPTFGTTALVSMDAEGNTVAITHSNGNSSGVVTHGLGFLYNNHMHNFNPRPGFRNSIAPHKMPESSDGPVFICQDGVPILAVAHYSRGGPTAEVQVVLNVLDFGMSIEEAVAAHRIHAEYQQRTILVDPDFPRDLIAEIESLGTQSVVTKPISPAVSAIYRDPSANVIQPGIDPRGVHGTAVAP